MLDKSATRDITYVKQLYDNRPGYQRGARLHLYNPTERGDCERARAFTPTTGPYSYEYPRPAVTVDIILFTFQENHLKVLLVRRKQPPYAGKWALPGGFVQIDEELEKRLAANSAKKLTSATSIWSNSTPLVNLIAIRADASSRSPILPCSALTKRKATNSKPQLMPKKRNGGMSMIACPRL